MAVSSKWRYEPETKTIRADPSNHWIASMDSWDGAVNHEANARLIAAAPDLLAALMAITDWAREHTSPRDANSPHDLLIAARALISKVEG